MLLHFPIFIQFFFTRYNDDDDAEVIATRSRNTIISFSKHQQVPSCAGVRRHDRSLPSREKQTWQRVRGNARQAEPGHPRSAVICSTGKRKASLREQRRQSSRRPSQGRLRGEALNNGTKFELCVRWTLLLFPCLPGRNSSLQGPIVSRLNGKRERSNTIFTG